MKKQSEPLLNSVSAVVAGAGVPIGNLSILSFDIALSAVPASGSATVQIQVLFGAGDWRTIHEEEVTSAAATFDPIQVDNAWREVRAAVTSYAALQDAGAGAVGISVQLEGLG